MSALPFEAPSIELLAPLLPAYEFEAFIAQGGMGAVYKARQRSLDRDVAIKILPREFGADPEFRHSFETEAKAMARLNHPNLIGVYDYGDVDGMPYIVMEFVNGKSLFHSAYNRAIDPVQAVGIVKGICDGLAHAHEHGIIHRDIKPANILLTPKAEPKIGDFGLARPVGADYSGVVMGTPGYAAPEITRSPEHADRRSDIFALGVVLYELLIGRCPPYEGSQPPPSVVSGCDPALDRICEKAMNPSADLRYSHAEEMSAALDAWLRRGPASASVHPPVRPVARPAPVPAGVRPTVHRSAAAGNARWLAVIVVTIAVIAGGWVKLGQLEKEKAAAEQAYQSRSDGGASKPIPVKPAEPVRPHDDGKPSAPPHDASTELATGRNHEVADDPLVAFTAMLRRTGKSVAAGEPVFPPGTLEHDGQHIFIAPHAVTRVEAESLAQQAGGHLVVLATAEKDTWLAGHLDSGPDGFWIGAAKEGGEWKWVDGEPWSFTRWEDASQADGGGGFAKIIPHQGWRNAYPGTPASGFIIEWGEDDEGTSPDEADEPAEIPALTSLNAKSRELMAALEKKHQEDLGKNANTLSGNLDTWLRRQNSTEKSRWGDDVAGVKAMIRDNRVPESVDPSTGVSLSADMAKYCTNAFAKQKTVDAELKAGTAKLHEAYVNQLKKEAAKATTAGDEKMARSIQTKIEESADLDAWMSSVGSTSASGAAVADRVDVEPQQEAPEESAESNRGESQQPRRRGPGRKKR